MSECGRSEADSSACTVLKPSSLAQILVNNEWSMSPIVKRNQFRNGATNSLILTAMVKPAKRRRKGEVSDLVVDGEKATVPPVTRLPFELIAEILLYSTTPADVLSLSRTCRSESTV